MKHITDHGLAGHLVRILELLARNSGIDFIDPLLRYILTGASHVTRDQLANAVRITCMNQGEAIMGTIAEELIAEGMEKGLEKGWEKGIEVGFGRGQVRSVVNLAARGILTVDQARQELENLVREGRITREQADAGLGELPR